MAIISTRDEPEENPLITLRFVRDILRTSSDTGTHQNKGKACGIDARILCLAEAKLDDAIRVVEREREALENALFERNTWSFDTLLFVAERLVTEVYPEDIFPDSPPKGEGDAGPQLVRAVRRVLETVEARKEADRG